MSDKKDEQALEEYLKGNSSLSRHYHDESAAEPPARLDAAIISAAKQAVENKKTTAGPFSARWYVPVSLAAVVVICFSVVFKIYDEDGQPLSGEQPELKMEKPAAALDDRMDQDAGEPNAIESGVTRDESRANEAQQVEGEYESLRPSMVEEDSSLQAPILSKQREAVGGMSTDAYKDELSRQGPAAGTPAATPVPAESQVELSGPEYQEQKLDAAAMSTTANRLSPGQWFEIINQLWFDGDEDGAMNGVKHFLKAYPDYPAAELKKMLPQNMDLSAIIEDMDETTEDASKRALTP